jgi:hypothetical protein
VLNSPICSRVVDEAIEAIGEKGGKVYPLIIRQRVAISIA